jgi:hypothetical protein
VSFKGEILAWGRPRLPIITIVLGLHAVLVYVFHQQASQRARNDRPGSAMTVVFIEERHGSSVVHQAEDDFLRVPELRALIPPALQAPVAIPPIAEPDEPVTPITDWYAQLTEAARTTVQRESEIASPRMSAPSQPVLSKPEVRKPERRAGTVEHFDGGVERYWVNANCYLEFDRNAPPLPSLGVPRPDIIRCTGSGSSTNGHLFDSVKPDYLRNGTLKE